METTERLQALISTRDHTFNTFAVNLYMENIRQPVFTNSELPLEIFKSIVDHMDAYREDIFGFIREIEIIFTAHHLTAAQRQQVCRTVRDFLFAALHRNYNGPIVFYDCYHSYLSYFKVIEEVAAKQVAQAASASTSISSLLQDMVQKQITRLSAIIDDIPAAQKARVITSLIKAIPEYNKQTAAPARIIPDNPAAGTAAGA